MKKGVDIHVTDVDVSHRAHKLGRLASHQPFKEHRHTVFDQKGSGRASASKTFSMVPELLLEQ